MKKMMIVALLTLVSVAANAMPFDKARNEALFLSDKMALELNLTEEQYAAVYEINLDYLLGVADRASAYGPLWSLRNRHLGAVLTAMQWNRYLGLNYFYRPVYWHRGAWAFDIYRRYADPHRFYRARPAVFAHYRGGMHRDYAAHWNHGRPMMGRQHAAPAMATRHHGTPAMRAAQHNNTPKGHRAALNHGPRHEHR